MRVVIRTLRGEVLAERGIVVVAHPRVIVVLCRPVQVAHRGNAGGGGRRAWLAGGCGHGCRPSRSVRDSKYRILQLFYRKEGEHLKFVTVAGLGGVAPDNPHTA